MNTMTIFEKYTVVVMALLACIVVTNGLIFGSGLIAGWAIAWFAKDLI